MRGGWVSYDGVPAPAERAGSDLPPAGWRFHILRTRLQPPSVTMTTHPVRISSALAFVASLLLLLAPASGRGQDARERQRLEALRAARAKADSLFLPAAAAVRSFSRDSMGGPVLTFATQLDSVTWEQCRLPGGDFAAALDSAELLWKPPASGNDSVFGQRLIAVLRNPSDTAAQRALDAAQEEVMAATRSTLLRVGSSAQSCRGMVDSIAQVRGGSAAVRYAMLQRCVSIPDTSTRAAMIVEQVRRARPPLIPRVRETTAARCVALDDARLFVRRLVASLFSGDSLEWKRQRGPVIAALRPVPGSEEAVAHLQAATYAQQLLFPRSVSNAFSGPKEVGTELVRGNFDSTLASLGVVAQVTSIPDMLLGMARGLTTQSSDSMLAGVGRAFRIVYEVINIALLRAVDRRTTLGRLEFETSSFVAYILEQCDNTSTCLDALYPTVREGKGLASVALGTALSPTTGTLLPLSPDEQARTTEGARAWIREVNRRGRADETAAKPFEAAVQPIIQKYLGDATRLADPDAGLLRRGEVFVDYYRYRRELRGSRARYGAFVTGPGVATAFVDLGEQGAIELAIERALRSVTEGRSDWRAAMDRVHDLTWAPVARHVPRTVTGVLVAPDGYLARVPWGLIPVAGKARLSIVASWSQLLRARRVGPAVGAQRALLVSDLDFGSGTRFEPTRVDADLATTFAGTRWNVEQLRGINVTREALRARAATAAIVSIITHGTVGEGADPASPWSQLERTQLALSNANRGGATTVSAAELAQWDLGHVQLLVLAACRTGGGGILDGQGVMGFPSAAVGTGARAALLSLWPAPNDSRTAEFLERFYTSAVRQGATLGEAIDAARSEMQAAHPNEPRLWAGWLLLGDATSRLQ